jgi:hypothetical protein
LILNVGFDPLHELVSIVAVDDAVVEGGGEVHHPARPKRGTSAQRISLRSRRPRSHSSFALRCLRQVHSVMPVET